jgi:hypothetical protein
MARTVAAMALASAAMPATVFVPQAGSLRASAAPSQAQTEERLTTAAAAGAKAAVGSTFGFAAIGLTAAAAAASAMVRQSQRAPRVERHVVGVWLPLTEKFDPLNMSNTDAKFDRYTAIEIKHGRVSMLAVMGYTLPELFRFPGSEDFRNSLGALSDIPVVGWIQLVALIGAHEVLVKPRTGGMGPADWPWH